MLVNLVYTALASGTGHCGRASLSEVRDRVDARKFQNLSMFLNYRLIHWVAYPQSIRYGKSDHGVHSAQKSFGRPQVFS